jgi:ABC-type sugar transport system permease subunit
MAATPHRIAGPARHRIHDSRRAWREAKWFYIFISPWLLGLICLSVIPLGAGFLISLSNFDGYNLSTIKFVGLQNYIRAFSDQNAAFALQRTILFTAINVPLTLTVSFCLALALTQRIYARSVFRTLFYLPSIIPTVAVAWIWKLLMDNNIGLVNGMIGYVMPGEMVRWLTDYSTLVLILLSLWINTGSAMVIFLAGLQNVPRELEEAALIDGATLPQMFRLITLPLVTPVIFYQLILNVIFSLQVLVEPMLLGESVRGIGTGLDSLPTRDNYLYMVHTFQQIFTYQRFGYGSALLWLLFVLILGLTLLVFRTSRHWVYYEVEQEGNQP